MYNHNKAQQSKNRVHISWDILYISHHNERDEPFYITVHVVCTFDVWRYNL